MLDTYEDSQVANELAEPVVNSLFEIQIIPNPSVSLGVNVEFLQEQIKTVAGLDGFERMPELTEQMVGGGASGLFPGIVVNQVIDLAFTANVNLRGDEGTEATSMITLKRMKDKQYNRATGARGLAKDCVFTVVIRRLTKDKKIWYVATCENCLFTADGITGLDGLDISANEAVELGFNLRSTKNKIQYASGF